MSEESSTHPFILFWKQHSTFFQIMHYQLYLLILFLLISVVFLYVFGTTHPNDATFDAGIAIGAFVLIFTLTAVTEISDLYATYRAFLRIHDAVVYQSTTGHVLESIGNSKFDEDYSSSWWVPTFQPDTPSYVAAHVVGITLGTAGYVALSSGSAFLFPLLLAA